MPTRKLRLAKETLSALDTGELRSVVGGATTLPCMINCNYTYCPDCVNDWTFEFCPAPTLPLEQCL